MRTTAIAVAAILALAMACETVAPVKTNPFPRHWLKGFYSIENGMTYAQVRKIMGRPTATQQTGRTVILAWTISTTAGGMSYAVMMVDMRVVNKSLRTW